MLAVLPIGIVTGALMFKFDKIAQSPVMGIFMLSVFAALAFFILFIVQLGYRAVTGIDFAIERKRLELVRKKFLNERPDRRLRGNDTN